MHSTLPDNVFPIVWGLFIGVLLAYCYLNLYYYEQYCFPLTSVISVFSYLVLLLQCNSLSAHIVSIIMSLPSHMLSNLPLAAYKDIVSF